MADDPELVRKWALVLDSQDIPYDIARSPEGWQLVVPSADAQRAAAALAAYARENPTVDEPETRRGYGVAGGRVALAAAIALAAFHAVTGAWAPDKGWFDSGAADAAAIRSGEVWRTVTALTLHADAAHVLSNALALALFGAALMSVLGSGAGLMVVLLSGIAGNALNVALRWGGYAGVGASTAVFGCVGALVGVQLSGTQRRRPRPWTAVFAGLMLLAMLGTGENTDVMAHALGFVSGLALGAVWGRWAPRPIGRRAQGALVVASALVVGLAWWLALR